MDFCFLRLTRDRYYAFNFTFTKSRDKKIAQNWLAMSTVALLGDKDGQVLLRCSSIWSNLDFLKSCPRECLHCLLIEANANKFRVFGWRFMRVSPCVFLVGRIVGGCFSWWKMVSQNPWNSTVSHSILWIIGGDDGHQFEEQCKCKCFLIWCFQMRHAK